LVRLNYLDEKINERVFMTFKNGYDIPEYTKEDYFQVLTQGRNFSLLKKFAIYKKDAPKVSYYIDKKFDADLINKQTYYFLEHQNNHATAVRSLSKRALLKAFDSDTELGKYFRDIGLKKSEKTEEQLAEIIKYYNTTYSQ